MQPELVNNENNLRGPAVLQRKESGWVKFWRVAIWGMVIIGMSIGAGLLARSKASSLIADGTYASLEWWGKIIFGVSTGVGAVNLVWGAVRWALRWKREHWTAGRVVGKLIGGGIWRMLVIAPVVVMGLLFLTPMVQRMIVRETAMAERRDFGSVSMLTEDYAAGKLNANEYVNYLLDAAYDVESLPKEYWSLQYVLPEDIINPIEENLENLSEETLERVLTVTSLAGIDFNEDVSGNVARGKFGAEQAYATTSAVVNLNKALLSPDKKFVIFYTDKGDDAITEMQAKTLAEMLDDVIRRYKSELGLNYTYEKFVVNGVKLPAMRGILIKNGIDENIMDTAMPVYVANPYRGHSNVLASYAGMQFKDFWVKVGLSLMGAMDTGEVGDMSRLYNSAPTLPFVNILPENLNDNSLKLVAAHELGHHYAGNYCEEHFGTSCATANFIDETLPNYMAVNVVPANEQGIGNLIQVSHHNTYIKTGTYLTIDEAVPELAYLYGYSAVAFLQNYAEIVPNAMGVMMGALKDDQALVTLYNATTQERFKEVMTNLTQKNLTNKYDGKNALVAMTLPRGEEIPCNDSCKQSYSIAPASSRYLYFSPSEYDKVKVAVKTSGSNMVSLLVRRGTQWEVLESSDTSVEYVIRKDADYNMVAFAVANYAIEGMSSFMVEISAEEMEDLIDEEESDEFGDLSFGVDYNGGNCIGINFDDVIDFPVQMMKIMSQYGDRDYAEVIAELEERNQGIKNELVYHYAMICLNQLKTGVKFDEAVKRIRNLSWPNLEFFRIDTEDDYHLSMIASYNMLLNQGKFYFLLQSGGGLQLMRVMMDQKIP